MLFGGELKSIRGQSVGKDCAGLQLVEKLATPLIAVFFFIYLMSFKCCSD